jgi:phage-related holin
MMNKIKNILEIDGEIINKLYLKMSICLFPIVVSLYKIFLGFYAPISDLLLPLFFLSLIDMCLGTFISFRELKWNSKRMFSKKAIVLCIFFIGLTSILNLEKFLPGFTSNFFSKMWMMFYATYEFASILEKLNKIYPLPFVSYFIKHFKSKLNPELKEMFESIEQKNDQIIEIAKEVSVQSGEIKVIVKKLEDNNE